MGGGLEKETGREVGGCERPGPGGVECAARRGLLAAQWRPLGAGGRRRVERRRRRRRALPGPGRGGGTPGTLRCARATLLRASAPHTKGPASPSQLRPRGTAGSAQPGGAAAQPAPQPRPRPRPGPTPLPPPPPRPSPPLSLRPAPPAARPFPTPLSAPPALFPLSGGGDFSGQRRSRGWEPSGSANPLRAESGPLSQGRERTAGCGWAGRVSPLLLLAPASSPPLRVISVPQEGLRRLGLP